jgi:hypothetical protein
LQNRPGVPEPVKLIAGIMGQNPEILDTGRRLLETHFGAIDSASLEYPFLFTSYYEEEMGASLIKQFVSFRETVDPGALADIKNRTNTLERLVSRPDGRPGRGLNLDPGYLNGAQLVLATTKNYSHRIYLRDGVFAEVTLIYNKGRFEPLPWTYRDYKTDLAIGYFQTARQIFLEQR